jgi:hypothetical protein
MRPGATSNTTSTTSDSGALRRHLGNRRATGYQIASTP